MKIYILLILVTISGLSQAENRITPEIQQQINADIAFVHSIKQLSQANGTSGYVGVGADASCNGVSSIQQALDLIAITGQSEIRVARNKTYNENIEIDDIDVSIIGGYLDCFNMGLPNAIGGPGNNQSIIDGSSISAVIRIANTIQKRIITLTNLQLTNGNSGSFGGGLIADNANTMLSLKNVNITNNTAILGAGIAIIAGDTDVLLENSSINNNTAKVAGGLYCLGALSSVILIKNSGITSNHANGLGIPPQPKGNGGGVYLDNCSFSMYSGSADNSDIGISSNGATGDGGGIYAKNNASIVLNGHEMCNLGNCIGDDINPVNVSANFASSGLGGLVENSGGGIYVESGSSIFMYAALISSNTSANNGGGIYVNGAEVDIHQLNKNCWDSRHCNYIVGNLSTNGSALFSFNSDTDISSAFIEGNSGASTIFTGDATNNNKTTRFEGSVFNHNNSFQHDSVIHGIGPINIEIVHSTFADNLVNDSILQFTGDPSGNPDLEIHSSIFHNPNQLVLTHDIVSNYQVNISHIIANEINSLSLNNELVNQAENLIDGPLITINDPLFVSSINRDYHLQSNSPAIDYALVPSGVTINYPDIDFQPRGIDNPSVVNNNALYFFDLGADEFFDDDLIFKDDFE